MGSEVTLPLLYPDPAVSAQQKVCIDGIMRYKVETGFEFDPQHNMPLFTYAILCFRVVSQMVFHGKYAAAYLQDIPENTRVRLEALENQVYRGPNHLPMPGCINPFLSALGLGKSEISQLHWQEWKNLGNMSMKSAAAKFLFEFSKYHPMIMDTTFEADGQVMSVKSGIRLLAVYVIQRLYRFRKQNKSARVLARQTQAVERLECFFITMLQRKHLCEIRLFAQENNYTRLLHSLLKGIPVNCFCDGKMVPKRLKVIKTGEADPQRFRTGSYILYCSSKQDQQALSDIERGILIADIAEVRPGCENFPGAIKAFKDADMCFSIIGSSCSFFLQLVEV